MSTFETRLQTQTIPVDDLVAMVKSGRVRIPSFQRGLRWQREDVIRLFDSIVKGYPIGNLLLWSRPAESARLSIGAIEIESDSTDQALFVVDGQQRITSLANVLGDEGQQDPRFSLSYDLLQSVFVASRKQSSYQIPLPEIFDLPRLLVWFTNHPELASEPILLQRATAVAKAIREFRVPVYVVEQPDVDVLRDIFDRMNNYGKKLTRAEVFTALNETGFGERNATSAPQDFDSMAVQIHATTGFGLLDRGTLLMATLARRGPDVTRDIRREFVQSDGSPSVRGEFPGETADAAREGAKTAMVKAILFLQEFGPVPHLSFLPYRYLLVVLTRFFAHYPDPAAASKRNLRRWYWRAAVIGPELFKGASITGATRSACSRIESGDEAASIAGLMTTLGGIERQIADVQHFRANWAASRIVLSGLWNLDPRNPWEPERRFGDEKLLDFLGEGTSARRVAWQIIPSSLLRDEESDAPGNRAFLAIERQDVPNNLFDQFSAFASGDTLDVFGDQTADVEMMLHSQLVGTKELQLLRERRYDEFVRSRQDRVMTAVREFLDAKTEWRFEDTPPLSIWDDDVDFTEDDSDDDPSAAKFELPDIRVNNRFLSW